MAQKDEIKQYYDQLYTKEEQIMNYKEYKTVKDKDKDKDSSEKINKKK